ncbi:molybdate ABC transporter substrate-binding protein [Lacrimispora defluvii]|uniref:Molybdate ABC transporter substrate-binding protein n=1 Tax=Lacrimispora defluvii TaxID=2719233 RepID=A0ABX1VSP3_9FIRM|nr:molybdate ABC transporter substrate-binding protein [Lacrimispora defluvii]NNJ31465.1 molybdate ABC transporter substrate-binding protein [Lacrimispora defluvii]
MKKRKRLLQMMMAVSLVGGLLSGCGQAGIKPVPATQAASAQTETSKPAQEKTTAVETAKAEEAKPVDVYVFIAASLKNTMEKIKVNYESTHPGVTIIYNADSSGTLQKQIEEGAQCDIFFSAAPKQMNALKDGGLVEEGSDTNLLVNKVVLIKPKGKKTAVTGFENITAASSLALAGEDVPVGQYARKLFTNMGILDQVMKMEINEGANVTAVLSAVAEGSNEVGVVYATDAASMPEKVEIIAEADKTKIDPAVYPLGLIKDREASEDQKKAAAEFKKYLTSDDSVMKLFTDAGFTRYTE